jgi:hypothetical protein
LSGLILMRLPLRFAALLALLALGAAPALAGPPRIEQVHIGLPGPNNSHLSRDGVWAPVFIRLTAGEGGNARNEYQLVVVTTDFDEAPYHFRTPVPALSEKEQRTVLSYVHPGGSGSEFAVRLETADNEEVQTVARLQRGLADVLDPRQILFLAAGAKLPALRQALEEIDKKKLKQQQQQQPDVGVVAVGPRGPEQHRMAYLEGVDEMPDRWFGYDAADVVVLSTSNARGFVEPLLEPGAAEQRNALLGWVRRGGTVVLSVGKNHQEVARLLTMLPLLDVEITGGVSRPALPVVSHWSQQNLGRPLQGTIAVAKVKPGPGVAVLVRERLDPPDLEDRPMVMQGSCGLGRVVLVAFDVDTEPFTAWPGKGDFWARIEELAGPRAPLPQTGVQQFAPGQYTSDELAGDLKTGLEAFQDVPVISFGWVALFILFYIVIVGPLDYLVLKKLFKRPELTWVTFPAVVIVVSVLAYVVAYSVKGDELRINKVDLIEYDLHEPRQAHGTTWFTLFSPRMQNYTLAVEPAVPEWAGQPPAGAPAANVLSLLEGGGDSLRTGSSSLFQQPYEYTRDASGLKGIPIPVWATQSFTASWLGSLPKENEQLPVGVDLHASRTKEGVLFGSITNRLPVELQGLTLFHDGKWYALGEPLGPGETRNVGPFFERIGAGKPLAEWFRGQPLSPGAPSDPSGRQITQGQLSLLSSHLAMQRILFYEAAPEQVPSNSGLRRFDQTWRLREQREFQARGRAGYRDEAILVARAPLYMGPAEELEGQDRSPSRLWLGELPGKDRQRPATPGHLFQETYLRIFAPVK